MVAAHTQTRTREIDASELVAGHPALDFVNTVDPRAGTGPQIDFISDYASLVHWASLAGLVTEERAAELAGAGLEHPRRAAALQRRAVELREALHRTVVALLGGDAPNPIDLELVRADVREALAQTTLAIAPDVGERGASALVPGIADAPEPEAVLWPIARSALDLLTGTDVTRWRRCPGDGGECGWIVLDTTRNRSRRWCDMAECGTEEKSKRLTERRRAQRSNRSTRSSRAKGA